MQALWMVTETILLSLGGVMVLALVSHVGARARRR